MVTKGVYSSGPVSLTVALTAVTTTTVTVPVVGVQVGDLVQAIPPATFGNGTYSAFVSAAGVITLKAVCGTASGNGTGIWNFIWTRLV